MKSLLLSVLAASFFTVCACTSNTLPTLGQASTPTSTAGATYADPQHRFAIATPADTTLRHDFRRSYFGNAAWKAFADPDSQGTPAAALVLDGSNTITAAELRIGTSEDDNAVAHCLDVPDSGVPSKGDAAMSHYRDVEGYRAVDAGRCYAIDLMISGTRPEVFDPPATPPFPAAKARQKLHDAVQGFRLQD